MIIEELDHIKVKINNNYTIEYFVPFSSRNGYNNYYRIFLLMNDSGGVKQDYLIKNIFDELDVYLESLKEDC